jgi:hypothetical protein
MRLMARQAIPHRWRMYNSLEILRRLVFMARQTQCRRRRGRQFHPRNILAHPHLMTGQASALQRRVNKLVLRLVFVTLQALLRVDVFVQRHRVHRRMSARSTQRHQSTESGCKHSAAARGKMPNKRKQFHTDSGSITCKRLAVFCKPPCRIPDASKPAHMRAFATRLDIRTHLQSVIWITSWAFSRKSQVKCLTAQLGRRSASSIGRNLSATCAIYPRTDPVPAHNSFPSSFSSSRCLWKTTC